MGSEMCIRDSLEDHLSKLPKQDNKSRAILEQMIADEKHHEETARQAGGLEPPIAIRQAMNAMSQLMKKTTYHI